MHNTKTQILFTFGPSSDTNSVFEDILNSGADAVRLNFSWGTFDEHRERIQKIREFEKKTGRSIPIIIDISGPRVKTENGHTYDQNIPTLTDYDRKSIEFGVKEGVDYFAQSFVGSASDVMECREIIKSFNGKQEIIAKIERTKAFKELDSIIEVSDAVMVARGDLGLEISMGDLAFVQEEIVSKCNKAKKPVIVATQMLYSMVDSPEPTRAEVTDVSRAVMQGADVTMLSDETARGKFPIEAVKAMEEIIVGAEKRKGEFNHNPLKRII